MSDARENLRKALADFREAQAELQLVIESAPQGEAGRLAFEAALLVAVEAGDRMQKAARRLRH